LSHFWLLGAFFCFGSVSMGTHRRCLLPEVADRLRSRTLIRLPTSRGCAASARTRRAG